MKVAIVGLGYVGLGLATALSRHFEIIGYDISTQRIDGLNAGVDANELISSQELITYSLTYTNNHEDIKDATVYIVTVSTPAIYYELPELRPLESATQTLAGMLKKGDLVIYESTVYPGTTEEVCQPILEQISHLKCGQDFNIAYSPERISPGDKVHLLENTTKIVAAQNQETLQKVISLYETICDTVYPVSNIATAEAVKILENTQRDTNIAFMNEFSQIMHAIGLNTHEIIEAAKTKWSFVPFKPGFVGGHCIAVDPQYLVFKAKRLGLHPDIILASRKINENMPSFIIQTLIDFLLKLNVNTLRVKIGILGLAYKENVKDARNSLALKLIKFLDRYHFSLQLNDPILDKEALKKKHGYTLLDLDEMHDLTAVIIVAGHDYYREVGLQAILKCCKEYPIILDIPNLFVDEKDTLHDVNYWSL